MPKTKRRKPCPAKSNPMRALLAENERPCCLPEGHKSQHKTHGGLHFGVKR